MSSLIVKNISIKNDCVLITGSASNVSPRNYETFVSQTLTAILLSQGKQAAEKEILNQFINWNFRGKSTIYGKFVAEKQQKSWVNFLAFRKEMKAPKNCVVKSNGLFVKKLYKTSVKLTANEYDAAKFNANRAANLAMRIELSNNKAEVITC